jgi:VanZ family protein
LNKSAGSRLPGFRPLTKEGAVDGAANESPARWGWLFPALWCGLIFLASSIPDITTPRGLFAPDKLIHLAEYGVLTALVITALSELTAWPPWIRAAAALAVCLGLGALDEIYQHTVSGRASDYLDFVSDAAGVIAGQAILLIGRIRRGRS